MLSNDSLLKMFQVMNPFEVLSKVSFQDMNFKSYYSDTLLKPYLLKWLDREEYFKYTIKQEREDIINNPEFIKIEINYILTKQGRKNELDSILNNPELFSLYRDSAIAASVNRYIDGNKNSIINVPFDAIHFHSYLAYPESYTIMKRWWEEDGKPNYNSIKFIALLRMGDPEARKIFDEIISECIETNGEPPDPSYFNSILRSLDVSYKVYKYIELLDVDKHYYAFSDWDPGMPYNCWVIEFLFEDFDVYSVEVDKLKDNDSCKYKKKHLPEIKAAAQKLIEKYKEEEYYWMKNMPFYEEDK